MASSSPRILALCIITLILLLNSVGIDGFDGGLQLNRPRRRRRGGSSRSRNRLRWNNVTLSVSHFGARGDGWTDDTQAFIEAWKLACSSRGTAVIEIPAEIVCMVRPVELGGPCRCKLTLMVLGRIIAPSDPDFWDGLDPHKWLYFHGVKDLVVTGGGTINGMGQDWWARSCKRNPKNPCRHAPTALTFHRIKRLTIYDLTLIDSQQMHMAFTSCFQVKASRLRLTAPARSPNTDGIHISSSNSVTIEDSIIGTGDDCISIVGNSSNVVVRNIFCGPGHGISIGSLGKYDSSAQVENVLVDGAFISNTENGVRIKTWQGGHGYARNIMFQNVRMDNVSNPIIVDQYYCDSKYPCQNQTTAVEVYDVGFVGIKGTSATEHAMKFACSDSSPCRNIYLEDVQLYLDSGYDPTAYCWKASGFTQGVVYPSSCLSSFDGLIEQNVITDAVLDSTSR